MAAAHPTVSPPEALGQSEEFLDFQERLSRVAKVDRPILLIGERGTGKELAASRLHFLSPRWQSPLAALNCAALAPSLVESELFGHEAGAFTGAAGRRAGRFEAADGGTLLLDEIGLIPLEAQEKILRVVEYGVFERVGGSRPVEVDVRILGATNLDLRVLAREGRFKQDLLDRLSFEVLTLPPLRERKGDVTLLANHFAGRMARELGRERPPVFTASALEKLEAHPWPGNIRELKNVVERAVYRSQDDRIQEIVFDPFGAPLAQEAPTAQPAAAEPAPMTADTAHQEPSGPGFDPAVPLPPFTQTILETEKKLLREGLKKARFNQRRAARLLDLSYDQLRGLIKKHGGVKGLE